jgi:hypothetical protein
MFNVLLTVTASALPVVVASHFLHAGFFGETKSDSAFAAADRKKPETPLDHALAGDLRQLQPVLS